MGYELSGTNVVLTWDASTDTSVDHYRVLRDGAFLSIANTTASFTDSTTVAGQTYTYEVQASNWIYTDDHQDIIDGLVPSTHVDSISSDPITVLIPSSRSFSEMTVSELKEIAQERGITGYSSMNKSELIENIGG